MKSVRALSFPAFRIAACLALATGVVTMNGCIQRDNPFDPLNAIGPAAEFIRVKNRPTLTSLAAAEKAFAVYLEGYLKQFAEAAATNSAQVAQNASTWVRNAAIQTANDSNEAWNNGLTQDQYQFLREKAAFEYLSPLSGFGPDPDFAVRRDSLQILSGNIYRFMTTVNASNKPLIIYPEDVFDSVLAPFTRDSAGFARLKARIDSGNTIAADSNEAIGLYNNQRVNDNQMVEIYNRNVEFLRQTQNRTVIARSDSLSSQSAKANAGDTLFLGAGIFEVDLRFNNSGTSDNPIVVRGPPNGGAIIQAVVDMDGNPKGSTLILTNQSNIRFEDLIFRKASISGVKLEANSKNIFFRRCQFDSSGQWGIEAIDSDLNLQNCIVKGNGGGIRATGANGSEISLSNTLVVRNRGIGLEGVSAAGYIFNCTISDNDKEGIHLVSPERHLRIFNSIVSGNKGTGILRNPGPTDLSDLEVSTSDIWGNQILDWNLSDARPDVRDEMILRNFNIDPEFTDSAISDYSVKPGSTLAGYETQPAPVIIGYRP